MSLRVYQPSNVSFIENKKQYKDLNIDDVISVQNGTVVLDPSFNKCGVYDVNGMLCPESVLLRWDETPVGPTKHNITHAEFINQDVIYLGTGYVFLHFGHFLTEGLSRVWPILNRKYQNKKVVIALDGKNDIPSFVRKILNAVGIQNQDIIIIHKTTRFARVFVPKQSMNIGINILPITGRVFDKIVKSISNQKIKTYDKIYLSRSAMNDGRTFGEGAIEKIFMANGYKIIYPETLPLEHQITLANKCHVMAGTAGTALHLAVFMQPKNRVIQIKRNSVDIDNIDVQKMICDLRGLDIDWVAGSVETVPTTHYTRCPQIVGITAEMIRFFDDNGFVYSNKDIMPETNAIKQYNKQIKKYKFHQKYAKFMNLFIRIVSLFGITKSLRGRIREFLRSVLNAKY